MTRHWTALPNFVDCLVFAPADDKRGIRCSLGIPESALVVGCVAAVQKHHKRIDYLIQEFARASFPSFSSVQNSSHSSFLLIAGARTDDTPGLVALAESLIPGRYRILTDCTRDRMPDLYRAMDVFVLTSLFEMMPIALLEALASGLPCLVNAHPVLEWMTGAGNEEFEHQGAKNAKGEIGVSAGLSAEVPANSRTQAEGGGKTSSLRPLRLGVQTSSFAGGLAIDMSLEGALSAALAGLTPEWIEEHGRNARERALAMFSKDVVARKYVEYYREVLGDR